MALLLRYVELSATNPSGVLNRIAPIKANLLSVVVFIETLLEQKTHIHATQQRRVPGGRQAHYRGG